MMTTARAALFITIAVLAAGSWLGAVLFLPLTPNAYFVTTVGLLAVLLSCGIAFWLTGLPYLRIAVVVALLFGAGYLITHGGPLIIEGCSVPLEEVLDPC